jgi:ribosomal protein S18 acetylase RimI-like enzyme
MPGSYARLIYMDLKIKAVGQADLETVVCLIREFAEFEDLSDVCEVTAEKLLEAMFTAGAVVEGLLAFDGALAIGYALFFPNFSSFRGQRGLYLDDIFVKNEYRGKGIGEALLKEIARLAASRGLERIDFLVLDWNTPAAGFYEKLGAAKDAEERHYKFTDDAFRRLAS